MVISMAGLGVKKTKVLAGAPNGRTAFAKLLAQAVQEPLAPEPLYLDFADVDIATARYLRESVLQFQTSSGVSSGPTFTPSLPMQMRR